MAHPTAHLRRGEATGVSFVNAAEISGEQSLDLALFGVPADSFLVERADARQALSGAPGLVLTSDLEGKDVKIGDRYRLGGSDVVLPVLGFTYGGFYGHVAIAFTSLRSWQSITYGSDTRGRYSAIALQVPTGTDVVALDRGGRDRGQDEGPGVPGRARLLRRVAVDDVDQGLPLGHLGPDRRCLLHGPDRAADAPDRPPQGVGRVRWVRGA